MKAISQFLEQCFKPFSATSTDNGVYGKLLREEKSNNDRLKSLVNGRLRNLYIGPDSSVLSKAKLPEADLKLTLAHTAKMLEESYPTRIIARLPYIEKDFWEKSGLLEGDWKGLAREKLRTIFSSSFLTPLEDTDDFFQIQFNHMNLRRYAQMLNSLEFHDDLDLVVEVHKPKDDINVAGPSFDTLFFDPSAYSSNKIPHLVNADKFLKHASATRPTNMLTSSLHPAEIAIFIYNRENYQDPIDVDDDSCLRIISATKKVPYIDFTDLSSMEPSHTELSTPDDMTTESMTLTSHLAVQERSFSDDALSSHCVSVNLQSHSPKSEENAAGSLDYMDDEGKEEDNEKIVYCEAEKDTSCVVDLVQANDNI